MMPWIIYSNISHLGDPGTAARPGQLEKQLGSYQLQCSTLFPQCQMQCSLIMCVLPLRMAYL